ncbi:DEAD/DEAH box helicase [Acidobacteria bacterium AH-259-L09]|nr:DEAD/DEAH box helicase [Acidobacteria bacterium AH-259-L09]
MSFAVGSLVRARGREWVVLPESSEELLMVQPLAGTSQEITGIYLPLETVEPASFDLPDPVQVGDHRSCQLLRDAVRLSFRSSAGPFRSFGRIAVEPRPYQLVPLLVGLKLDPIRLLIADDVGIGKTIEACLLLRELLDRGEVERFVVLCPPQLAEQWQDELKQKFHLDAPVLLPSTARRLEQRRHRIDQSVFDVFPYLIVSTDYIKADRRRDEFLRSCPEMVIIDEAHTFAFAGTNRGSRHQRHQLLKGLAAREDRHLMLVTATPHSGKEDAFRSLLSFLRVDFANLPPDLTGPENERHRRRLAQHLVQRRRGDIVHFLNTDTPFPERESKEENYKLSPQYKKLFERVLDFARESVLDQQTDRFRQRVRWWSALALLRSLASCPAAAAETLRNRAATSEADSPEDADEIGRRTILDIDQVESMEGADVAPGSNPGEDSDEDRRLRRRLLEMARVADSLKGAEDNKLKKAVTLVQNLVDEGFHPIVFCRFIPTAEYVAAELRRRLKGKVEVAAVTGLLPPAERKERILALSKAESKKYVLVCTDCLSEGINLQDHFDAVMHYDLSWNPTRHEQREGRADRYGQPSKTVRILTYYGIDNQIDGIVLDVLLRKHHRIRTSLGISVPVPVKSEDVIEAIFEGLLLRERSGRFDDQLKLFEDAFEPEKNKIHSEWEKSAEREKLSRTMFAQQTIKAEEVASELEAVRSAIGSSIDVARFVKTGFRAHKGLVSGDQTLKIDLDESPRPLRDLLDGERKITARFEKPVKDEEIYLTRTHPIVEGLATYVLDTALDPQIESAAHRCGALRTHGVSKRTTLLLVRFRFHILTIEKGGERQLLAEDCQMLAFQGSPQNAVWLDDNEIEGLLELEPAANIYPEQARQTVRNILDEYSCLEPRIEEVAHKRGQDLLEAHQRVRKAAQIKGIRYKVEPKLPADLIGVYVFLPAGGA